jgi:hypothetical protein
MSIKDFFLKKIIQSRLKGLPKDQQEMILKVVREHPELFKKIGEEIKVKQKSGMNQQAATMQVMRAHQAELQQIMLGAQGGGGNVVSMKRGKGKGGNMKRAA